jgi:hypothetical protein
MKIFHHSEDCDRSVSVVPSGADGLLTLEIATRFPLARSPVWQRNVQITASPCALWELASEIHNAVHTHITPAHK